MSGDNSDRLVGGNAVAVEMAILSLLSPIVWGLSTYWKYDLVFLIAGVIAGIIFLFRIMARDAEDPDIELIRRSLGWSSRLLDLLLIGVIAAISIRISIRLEFLPAVAVFAGLAIVSTFGFVLLEQWALDGYAGTWKRVINEETNDDLIGRLLREAGEFGEKQMSVLGKNESPDPPAKGGRGLVLAIGLFLLLFVVTLPVWLVLLMFFENWQAAVLVVFSLLFLRDTTRFLYVGYGPVSELSELRWPLKWEFVWSAVKGIIIAWTLGYELTGVL